MMGIQGAGKSSEVAKYIERGYARLNRDLLGGDLDGLVPKLAELLSSGQRRVVLDNTYATRVSRYALIRAAHAHGVPVRCRHMATPIDEAYAYRFDTPDLVRDDHLEASRDLVLAMVDQLEADAVPINRFRGEVFCSRYGLHVDWYRDPAGNRAFFDLMYLVDGTRSVAQICV